MSSGLAHDFSNLLSIIPGMKSKLARIDLVAEADTLNQATRYAVSRGGRLLKRIADMTVHRTLHPRPTNEHTLPDNLKLLAGPN